MVRLVFGMPRLVEQHGLRLLGRPEVQGAGGRRLAVLPRRPGRQGGVRVGVRLLHLGGEVRLHLAQAVDVDGDAELLHLGEHADERDLDVAQQGGRVVLLELGVEALGEVEHRAGAHHRLLVVGRAGVAGRLELERALRLLGRGGRVEPATGDVETQARGAGGAAPGRPGRRSAGRA
ncbi:hypothetical protein GCM10025868_02940 [Angustibacter aerolatus]|uniref:Uncharacterized protein n=1 Tax=Angustibacter aerolatus TaxID=1162965 RepID=A0ABQ6JC74_9ACTN|nr:hypothetical protein GCM10025868_02940 [Angustibacter aerolatus]